MSNRGEKPKKTASALVHKMRDELGITFCYTSESEAKAYLTDVNNYMRVAAYRKNYQKAIRGANTGKYVHLDFAYLQELAVIDMHFRFLVMQMCSDIEHALKVQLVADVEQNDATDGYDIVADFLQQNPVIVRKIESTVASPFTTDLVHKYFPTQTVFNPQKQKNETRIISCSDCPVWVLAELLTFGDFLYFYEFYYASPQITRALNNMVKSLRNAAAHNNCILADLNRSGVRPPRELTAAVAGIPEINVHMRKARLSSRPTAEFAALLYVYDRTVHGKVREHRVAELKELFRVRIPEKKAFFTQNELLCASYDFATRLINGFFG